LYSSPEQYGSSPRARDTKSKKFYTQKTDVYSAGIILFEMVADLQTEHERVLKIKALKETGKCPLALMGSLPSACKLVERIVAVEEKSRPRSTEVFSLPEYLDWAKEFGHI
jgi:serine/threonine protein kinase